MKPATRSRKCIIAALTASGGALLAVELERQRTTLQCSERSWRIARAELAREEIIRRTLRTQRGAVVWVLCDGVIPKREKTRAMRFVAALRAQIARTDPPPSPRIPSKYRHGSKKWRRAFYSRPSLDRLEVAREIAAQEDRLNEPAAEENLEPATECNWHFEPGPPAPKWTGPDIAAINELHGRPTSSLGVPR